MKTLVTETSTLTGGQPTTAVTSSAVTSIVKAALVTSDFTVPPEYDVMDMDKIDGAGRGRGTGRG